MHQHFLHFAHRAVPKILVDAHLVPPQPDDGGECGEVAEKQGREPGFMIKGEKEKENEVPAGSIGTDGRNGPENAIDKSDPIPPLLINHSVDDYQPQNNSRYCS